MHTVCNFLHSLHKSRTKLEFGSPGCVVFRTVRNNQKQQQTILCRPPPPQTNVIQNEISTENTQNSPVPEAKQSWLTLESNTLHLHDITRTLNDDRLIYLHAGNARLQPGPASTEQKHVCGEEASLKLFFF